MAYTTLPLPYDYWSKQLTPSAARKAMEKLAEEFATRLSNIRGKILVTSGVDVSPACTNDVLNLLPEYVAILCRFDESYRPQGFYGMMHPTEFDAESLQVLFDSALLLGEIFRFRYPASRWAICRTPVSSIDYGQPVLVNDASPKRNEFGPLVEMKGQVGAVLLKQRRPEWPLPRLLQMRACAIDLAPDPRELPRDEPGQNMDS